MRQNSLPNLGEASNVAITAGARTNLSLMLNPENSGSLVVQVVPGGDGNIPPAKVNECVVGDKTYKIGDTWGVGCNGCSCTEHGAVCTL